MLIIRWILNAYIAFQSHLDSTSQHLSAFKAILFRYLPNSSLPYYPVAESRPEYEHQKRHPSNICVLLSSRHQATLCAIGARQFVYLQSKFFQRPTYYGWWSRIWYCQKVVHCLRCFHYTYENGQDHIFCIFRSGGSKNEQVRYFTQIYIV